MAFDWIKRASELKEKGFPFAIATVINTVAPTSAKPMSKAIIHQNGEIEGWIGGGCSINTVITESLNCIKNGKSIVLRLSKTGRLSSSAPGRRPAHTMLRSCAELKSFSSAGPKKTKAAKCAFS